MSKIMRVFYDNAGLPYKDSALSIHYPILEGVEFVGANNTTDIYFYTENLGDFYFVANCKLPNGALVDKLLIAGSDEFGTYYALSLDSELTENKGHLKVALKGYGGNVSIEEESDGETTIVVINGTPTIVATGIVDIAINYAPLVHHISTLTPSEYEELLAVIGTKLNIVNGIYVIDETSDANLDLEGEIYYVKETKEFYKVVSGVLEKEFFDCILTSNSLTGTLDSTQVAMLSNPQGYFVINNVIYTKAENNLYVGAEVILTTVSQTSQLSQRQLTITNNNGVYTYSATTRLLTTFYNKDQTDALLNTKVSKSSSSNIVYGRDDTQEVVYPIDDFVDGNVVRRNTNGNIYTPLPQATSDATPKQYVDGFAKSLLASINTTTYVMTLTLEDANGNTLGTPQTIDLPLESLIVSGSYDENTQSIILVTRDGQTISIPVGDLVAGLVSTTDLNTALALKQDTLVSGTNIKTINNQSILGSGNIDVEVDLTDYAKVDGNYQTMTVGMADNLTPYSENSGADSEVPFVFRTTGGSADVGSTGLLKELRGQSYELNQLFKTNNITKVLTFETTDTAPQDIQAIDVIAGHKYLLTCIQDVNLTSNTRNTFVVGTDYETTQGNANLSKGQKSWIYTADATEQKATFWWCHSPDVQVTFTNFQIFDLTLMFGAGNEPTSVLEFNRLFGANTYAYSLGSIVSSQTSKLIEYGYNQFDEVWGAIQYGSYTISTNFIRVVAGQTYTIENYVNDVLASDARRITIIQYDSTKQNIIGRIEKFNGFNDDYVLDDNCQYIKLELAVGGLTTDIIGKTCVHLTWDGSKTGYEPYEKHEYNLPNIELRSAISIYDTIKPNGTLTRKVGVVDLGTLDYYFNSDNGWVYSQYISGAIQLLTGMPNALLGFGYTLVGANELSIAPDKSYTIYNGRIYIKDSSYTDATTFAQDMNGVMLHYELATPTTEQVSSYSENLELNDFGTEEFVSTYPQKAYLFYPVDYKAFIDSLGEMVDYDASKILTTDNVDLSGYAKESVIAPAYDNTQTYSVGAKVIYNEKLYKCTTAVTSVESFDSNKWTEITVSSGFASEEQGFNVINASDIVNNTLTQAQYDLITNGKLTKIIGSLQSLNDILIVSAKFYQNNVHGVGIARDNTSLTKLIPFTIDSSKVIYFYIGNEIDINYGNISLLGQIGIKGKSVPNYPTTNTSPQYLQIGANGGALSYNDPFNPTSVSISDGGTISDTTLQANIQYHRPIVLNGFTCYFSCDDGTNYQYTSMRYDANANKNHINVITINKSTWIATFHTSDIALN